MFGKLVDKTLSDIDYAELSKYVYGKELSSDVARREMYGSRYTLQLLDEAKKSGIEDSELANEISERLDNITRESQKLYDQRREYKKILASEGRSAHLHNIIKEAASELNDKIGLVYQPQEPKSYLSDDEAVIVFSDWHYGMKASNVFNQYDTSICKQRVQDTVNKMIQRISFHNCSKAHIVLLGDFFHGAIHVSARVASEEVVCEQIMHVSEILAQSIYEISKYVDETIVYSTYGNHARTVQNKKDNIHNDNMERLINWWLVERFKDNPSVVIAPESENEFILMNVCGHGFCASHGDLDNVNNSPRLLTTLFQKKYGTDIEYILLGDKHHRESFNELGVTSMLCGSLCGTDDYANDKRLYSTPSQMLLIVNDKCGVDAEYRIQCE